MRGNKRGTYTRLEYVADQARMKALEGEAAFIAQSAIVSREANAQYKQMRDEYARCQARVKRYESKHGL